MLRDENSRPLLSAIVWPNVNKAGEMNDHIRNVLGTLCKCIAIDLPENFVVAIAVINSYKHKKINSELFFILNKTFKRFTGIRLSARISYIFI